MKNVIKTWNDLALLLPVEARDKFKANIKKTHGYNGTEPVTTMNFALQSRGLKLEEDFLMASFPWVNTPEGMDYWWAQEKLLKAKPQDVDSFLKSL